jgi:hypothetical protein
MIRSIDCLIILFVAAWIGGCGGKAESQSHGSATYAKPASQGGQYVAPQQNQQDMAVTVAIDGSGTFTATQAACTLTNGSLSETTTSTAQVNSDGSYVSAFSTESASGSGPSELCGTLESVKLTSITSMTVQATIPANSPNCQGYCKATASVQCQGSADSNCLASAATACTVQCQGSTKIKGHGSLQSADMAQTNSQLAAGQSDVDAKVDLVFDGLQ